jgi:hypothetical protein
LAHAGRNAIAAGDNVMGGDLQRSGEKEKGRSVFRLSGLSLSLLANVASGSSPSLLKSSL